MDAFLISTCIVALAEIGDKTQLLAFLLAARYKRPWTIVLGILLATVANHVLAALLGGWLTTLFAAETLRWILGISFIAMALWILVPDSLDASETAGMPRWGVFGTTLLAFFLAEMGDKTQIATVALAAQYQSFFMVVMGTTLGMMIANAPAVFVGERLASRVPVKWVHVAASLIFIVLGLCVLAGFEV